MVRSSQRQAGTDSYDYTPFLVLNLGLDIVNGVGRLHLYTYRSGQASKPDRAATQYSYLKGDRLTRKARDTCRHITTVHPINDKASSRLDKDLHHGRKTER